MIVVRDGRVVHHELDPALEAKGVRVVRHRDVRRRRSSQSCSARASRASEDAFTVLHDAFLAGGAFVHVPAGVVVEDPILVLHWCEGDGRGIVPAHARRARRARRGDGARPLRLARRPTTSSTRSPSCSSATTRTCATSPCRSTARARGTSGCQRAHVGRDATAAHVGGRARRRLRAAAQRGAARGPGRRERPARGLLRRRRRRCSTSARSRTTTRRARAATCCSRARSRTTPVRCTPGSCTCGQPAQKSNALADEPQPRAHRRRERGVDPEPRDRGERRALLARVDRRPDRRRPALLPRVAAASRPRRPSG